VLLADEKRIDLDAGTMEFVAGDEVYLTATLVPVGSWGRESVTWMWAWANSGMPPHLRERSAVLTTTAELAGRAELFSESPVPATEQQAWEFAALACSRLDGAGVYSEPDAGTDWFFVLLEVERRWSPDRLEERARQQVEQSLLHGGGAGLLNIMRRRFPSMRLQLVGSDLRGPPQPWAHDLHAQILFDSGRLGTHEVHDLRGANLSAVRLDGAILRGVDLREASLEGCSLVDADLSGADLRGASLRSAFLNGANLTRSLLAGADLGGAELSRTLLNGVDLSDAIGLGDVHHLTPSEISLSTLVASRFQIQPAFLRRAGVGRGLLQDLYKGRRSPGLYQTCFLSYSSKDGEFAAKLYGSLAKAHVRVFWDHFDVLPGEQLADQIEEAIREHDRLVVALSPHSMASRWVAKEVETAWSRKPDSLLPIRLSPIEDVRAWTQVHDGVPDLAEILPIQDFSSWHDPAQYEHALAMLLKALAGGVGAAGTA
jgi:uncharacterized protein YjbI with pentapeptide repeats